jgi:DNA-binding transcriptional regulator YiaG
MSIYHYTECCLDNVLIKGLSVHVDGDGEEVCRIPNVKLLHRAIAAGVVRHEAAITPRELRFLRIELGLTQAELARIMHVDTQTVGRWERGETPLHPLAEAILRRLATERLGLDASPHIVPAARAEPIRIDASDPGHYRLAA